MTEKFENFSLEDWLGHFEASVGDHINLGLERVRCIAERLGLLHPARPVITVAGTNGKGSTVATLERIYTQAGYKAGVYTSPHLQRVNERIRYHAQEISDEDFCAAFKAVQRETRAISLTYFEVLTLAALWYFDEKKPDLIILEVGLGGRLDATNIIDADVAIISSIDFDHQDFLGETLEAIASEKAGIFRAGQKAIYADDALCSWMQKLADEKGTILYCCGRDYEISEELSTWKVTFKLSQSSYSALPLSSLTAKAKASAMLAVDLLKDQLPISVEQMREALVDLQLPGRLQYIPGRVNRLYDVAHNPQAARLLARFLSQLPVSARVHAVFSALKDKDIAGLISPLKDFVDCWYPAVLKEKRAADKVSLKAAFNKVLDSHFICYDSIEAAYLTALSQAEPGDLILIYGSFYVVSQIMDMKSDLPEHREKE